MSKRYNFAVYGTSHPAFTSELLGRYRWRWTATLKAWWWRTSNGSLLWPHAWVRDERVTVFVKDGKVV
jgi:hypothetical protein